MNSLIAHQHQFSLAVAGLILEAAFRGYGVAFGEAWRSPEEARRLAALGRGIVQSLHCDRLAVDLCLFKGGAYLTKSEDYAELGAWWESQGGAWGGRWGDGNHFSWPWGGRK